MALTTSASAAPHGLLGVQEPRILWLPPSVSSAGGEAVELSRMAGLMLDPWEEFILANSLNERPDGKWAAFEVGVVVPRQNGKGSILEARELAGLFLLGEQLLIHSAHLLDTSLEAFRRLLMLIEDTPDFDRRVMRVNKTNGAEGIELKGGQRIRFRTRTKGGGRGHTGDVVILDEAMELFEAMLGALVPTMAARSIKGNPQLWYAASAVDQQVMDNGVMLARVRERGLAGGDESLAYFEHSVEGSHDKPEELAKLADDPQAWAQGNPGMGIRIAAEHIARERRAMPLRTFCVERLGIGDWPRTDDELTDKLTLEMWLPLEDPDSKALDPVCLAFDVRPDRSASAISAAGMRRDGKRHIETIEHKRGTGWVVGRLVELVAEHKPVGVVVDMKSPAASLVPDLAEAGIEVEPISTNEHAQACGMLYDACDQKTLRHLGTPEMTAAVAGAVKRRLGEAWGWSRKDTTVDISPLVAGTLALWGSATLKPKRTEPMVAWR
jgi:phage terminase large subunit-like protein